MPSMDASSYLVLAALTLCSVVAGCSSLNLPGHLSNRRLLEDINLAAIPRDFVPVMDNPHVPSTGSGSFPASGKGSNDPNTIAPPPPANVPAEAESHKRSLKWLYIVVPVVASVLLAGLACVFLLCRKSSIATSPWRTGLSGQLQKAFVTGVTKLQHSELERACEGFSNIVATNPHYTVYKGTLSSGVEIAVISTTVTQSKDWSDYSESCFRKKIDSLSRINHKNFINLLGFCEEEEPFARMMVLEYAPNGTLYENLHGAEGFDHIDWRGRMRIIMGITYCVQHMHELSPPVVHPHLISNSILISEDGAAKIADMSVWQDVSSKGQITAVSAEPAGNVYSFGVLLLEIISGKLPHSKHEGSFVNLALDCMNGGRSLASLVDPALGVHKETELETICQVIQDCIQSDWSKKPTMRDIATTLREATGISPVAATPRLSPLWWAELEVLSTAEGS